MNDILPLIFFGVPLAVCLYLGGNWLRNTYARRALAAKAAKPQAPIIAPPSSSLPESILTEADRRRLIEEISAIVESALPPLLNRLAEDSVSVPRDVGSLDEWYGSRSTIPPKRIMGRTEPNADS